MAIEPKCDKCKKELDEFGAILLGPPDQNGLVNKFHLCKSCYYELITEIKNNMKELQLSERAKNLKLGIYQHYKGGKYKIIGVAFHSETLEEMVIYQAQYGENNYWVRPLKEFLEEVEYEGGKVIRFKLISCHLDQVNEPQGE